jgi:hypothetical protein
MRTRHFRHAALIDDHRYAVGVREVVVENDDVGLDGADPVDRIRRRADRLDHVHLGTRRQRGRQQLGQYPVVVDDDDPDDRLRRGFRTVPSRRSELMSMWQSSVVGVR